MNKKPIEKEAKQESHDFSFQDDELVQRLKLKLTARGYSFETTGTLGLRVFGADAIAYVLEFIETS